MFNGFLVLIVNWLIIKQIVTLNLNNRYNWRWKKTFCFLLLNIDPRTSSLTALSITHCSDLSFCLLLLICLHLSSFMFLDYRFVSKQLYCLFIINLLVLSVFSVAFSCFSVFFKHICCLSFYTIIEHVCSPLHTVFYRIIGLCFVKRVCAFNSKLINNETDWNA